MRACWLKWVGRDWSISADYIWLNYSDANKRDPRVYAINYSNHEINRIMSDVYNDRFAEKAADFGLVLR